MRYNRKLNEMSRPAGIKNIPLQKYGFVRVPEEDFSDDGTRFTVYAYDPEGKGDRTFLMSKATYNGEAFLSVYYTLPGTQTTQYIDDLNGVSIDEAIKGLDDLVKKIKEAQEKVTSFTAQTLTDEDIEKFSDEVAEKVTGNSGAWRVAEEVLKQHGFDEDQLESSIAMKYRKAWEAKVKDKYTKSLSKDKIRAIAADLLRKAISSYHQTYDIGKAIEGAWASISDKDGYISIGDLDDATVKRMRDWAKRKLTSADDFE